MAKMQIFGSTYYPTVQNPKQLDARSKKGVFVGYDRDSPNYLVYDPDTRALRKHRLVVKFTFVVNPLPDADGFIPASEEPNIKPESSTSDVPITKSELKKYPLRSRQQQPSPSEVYSLKGNPDSPTFKARFVAQKR